MYVKTLLKHKCFHLFAIICLKFDYMDIGIKGIAWCQGDGLVGKAAREILATKTDSLGLLSRAHMVEEKN